MLDVANLSFEVNRRALLRNTSLRARAGEIVAIVGANGAGKSTLLRILSGELAPSGGTVTLDGKPLASFAAPDLARRRGVLSQQHTLALAFAVRELVLMGRYPHFSAAPTPHDYAIVDAALSAVDLTHLADRAYPTLSGGEQQRAQLARVLAQVWEAPGGLLLLDEPLTGLDLQHQHHTLDVARALARRGFAVVAVLHDLNLAAQYADQALLLRHGLPVAFGAPADVLTAAHIQVGFGMRVQLLAHPTLPVPLIVPLPHGHATPAA